MPRINEAKYKRKGYDQESPPSGKRSDGTRSNPHPAASGKITSANDGSAKVVPAFSDNFLGAPVDNDLEGSGGGTSIVKGSGSPASPKLERGSPGAPTPIPVRSLKRK